MADVFISFISHTNTHTHKNIIPCWFIMHYCTVCFLFFCCCCKEHWGLRTVHGALNWPHSNSHWFNVSLVRGFACRCFWLVVCFCTDEWAESHCDWRSVIMKSKPKTLQINIWCMCELGSFQITMININIIIAKNVVFGIQSWIYLARVICISLHGMCWFESALWF